MRYIFTECIKSGTGAQFTAGLSSLIVILYQSENSILDLLVRIRIKYGAVRIRTSDFKHG